MAELSIRAGHSRKAGGRRSKKLYTRVDLTPMVDLGFLLITFFFVTTTWSKPHATRLYLPADGDNTLLGENAALTILAGSDNKVFYYHGKLGEALKKGSYGITGYDVNGGIGDIIRQKQQAMDKSYHPIQYPIPGLQPRELRSQGGRKELMLLIKPSSDASYKNVIDLLDETMINRIGLYALVDITEDEKKLLKEKKL